MNVFDEIKKFDLYMHEILEEHCKLHLPSIGEMYYLLECLIEFKKIYPPIESVLIMNEVHSDLFNSIYLATKGMYRNAFISLRSSLELSIGYLYFYDNNLDYLKWTKNKFDLSWSRLNDDNYGILKKEYLNLFVDISSKDQDIYLLLNKIKEIYRVCSEYTHGKFGYMKTNLTSHYEYNESDYLQFIEHFKDTVTIIICLHSIRFNNLLLELPSQYLDEIEILLKSYNLTELVKYE